MAQEQSTEPSDELDREVARRTLAEEKRAAAEASLELQISMRRRAEQQLAASEEKLRLMITGAEDYALITIDTAGRITGWNCGAERLFGWGESEIVGEPFARLFTPEDQQAGVPECELKTAADKGTSNDDRWHMRKDGSRLWVLGVTTILMDSTIRGYVKLVRDMTEQKRAEEQLKESEARAREQAEQLKKLHQQKDQFLAVLAHELRNPLASIHTAAYLVCERTVGDPLVKQACNVLERQVQMLTHLVNDLLDAARITSGKVTLRKEWIDLRSIAENAVEMARPLINARGQQLSVSVPDAPVMLEVDPLRIEQVTTNLLTNAAKYTPEGGRIWLAIQQEEQSVVLRVRDNGIGIAPEMLPRIFTLFTQADAPLNRREAGLGIGLALARTLVELHGGAVEAHSEGLGKGSEFGVRLPLPPRNGEPQQSSPEPALRGQALRILVVDDNADAADMFAAILRLRGHVVQVEYSGAAALQNAAAYQPDVVFLDIGMPEMNGYEVAKRLRQLPELKNVTLIALSGFGQEADVARSQDAGFNSHLVKPADIQKLNELLSTVAAQR